MEQDSPDTSYEHEDFKVRDLETQQFITLVPIGAARAVRTCKLVQLTASPGFLELNSLLQELNSRTPHGDDKVLEDHYQLGRCKHL